MLDDGGLVAAEVVVAEDLAEDLAAALRPVKSACARSTRRGVDGGRGIPPIIRRGFEIIGRRRELVGVPHDVGVRVALGDAHSSQGSRGVRRPAPETSVARSPAA